MQIEIISNLSKVPPVAGNAAELREVLTNLVFNAVDAMPNGGTITLTTQHDIDSATISIQEGLDIGEDVGSPVDFTYKPPFAFTGKIEKVTVELK